MTKNVIDRDWVDSTQFVVEVQAAGRGWAEFGRFNRHDLAEARAVAVAKSGGWNAARVIRVRHEEMRRYAAEDYQTATA